MYIYVCICMYIYLSHFALHLKVIQHCKLTIIQLKKKTVNKNSHDFSSLYKKTL